MLARVGEQAFSAYLKNAGSFIGGLLLLGGSVFLGEGLKRWGMEVLFYSVEKMKKTK
jgi:hypothetical protein